MATGKVTKKTATSASKSSSNKAKTLTSTLKKVTTKKVAASAKAKTAKSVTAKTAAKKVTAKTALQESQVSSSGIEVLSPAAQSHEIPEVTAESIDMGWVFYFSVDLSDVSTAWGILSEKLSGKAVRTGRISAAEYFASDFAPRHHTRGDLFVMRRTPTSTEDLGMLAGEIEDAFRDAGIRPGPMLPDTRTIEGVQFTYYRNETDDEGKVLMPSELAEMRTKNPFLLMYNPLEKTDPWDDLYYEYVPTVEETAPETIFATIEPAQERRTASYELEVEDFDHDLGTLLNKVFTGVSRKYLTQPEGVRGWVFDKGFGRLGKPSYRFYACGDTIIPVQKTLEAAGFDYTSEQRGDWSGVHLPLESFKKVQRTLSNKQRLRELREFFQTTAQTIGDNVPALPAPSDHLPFGDDHLFVSDI